MTKKAMHDLLRRIASQYDGLYRADTKDRTMIIVQDLIAYKYLEWKVDGSYPEYDRLCLVPDDSKVERK